MRALGVGLVLLGSVLATPVAAEPIVRFGMTSGADRNSPEGAQVGPLLAVGGRTGRVTGEVNYGYLSFMDPDTNIHRAGVALRMELTAWDYSFRRSMAMKAIYAEVGAAKRWGNWRVNDALGIDATTQNEVHVGIGFQYGRVWQLGVRLGASREHPMLGVSCRSCSVATMPGISGGIAESVMAEWMWTYGTGR